MRAQRQQLLILAIADLRPRFAQAITGQSAAIVRYMSGWSNIVTSIVEAWIHPCLGLAPDPGPVSSIGGYSFRLPALAARSLRVPWKLCVHAVVADNNDRWLQLEIGRPPKSRMTDCLD
jgi:hypothetical protein